MSKLNCSFPWIKSKNETLEKCGPYEKIKDLVDLVNKVNKQQSDILLDLKEFGCNTLNCQETKWTISSWQSMQKKHLPGFTKIILNFPSSTKVYNPLQIKTLKFQ